MTQIANKDLWRELFNFYKENPVLWRIKSREYKNKMKKNQAWELLLEKCKEIEPDANLISLKNRITNIKTSYRRELKKVSDSMKSGAGEEEVYVPSLWYFNELEFLKDQEDASDSISSLDFDLSKTPSKRPKNNQKQEFLQQACMHLDNLSRKEEAQEDEADVYAKSWACSYRKMNAEQQLYAKKAIEEILILGQLKQLSLNVVSTSPPISSSVSSPRSIPGQHIQFFSSTSGSSRTSTPISSSPLQYIQFPAYVKVPERQQSHSLPNTQTFVGEQKKEASYANMSELLGDNQFS